MKKLIAFCSDGATVNTGLVNGVIAYSPTITPAQNKQATWKMHSTLLENLPQSQSGTRWLSHTVNAITNLFSGYDGFVLHLGQVCSNLLNDLNFYKKNYLFK